MSNDLTNQKIKDTYGRVVQYVSGSFYDLLGNFIPTTSGSVSTASYALTSSYSVTSSYYQETDPIFVNKSSSLATTGSNIFIGNQTITGSLIMSGSIQSVNWIDFIITDGYPHQEGRIHWTEDTKTLQLDTDVNNFNIEVGHQSVVRVRNVTGDILTKGKVVYIDGESGNRPTVVTASYVDEEQSFNAIGVIAQDINNSQTGYIVTDGLIRGINTTAYSPGTKLFLSSSGDFTSNTPSTPLHQVTIGKTITQAVDGVIYIKIRPGYAIDDLHDVLDSSTTSSYGDLLVKSGSVWINSKQLTGSYGLTGSLTANSLTGSLQGTSSWSNNSISSSYASNGGVTQLIAGTGIELSPTNGLGAVTITSTATGGGGTSGSNANASFISESIWNFNHNLGNRFVVIQVFDSNYNEVIPENIQLTSISSSIITFPTSESGYAVASLGGALSSSYSLTSSYALTTPNPNYKIVSSSYTLTIIDSNVEVITLGVTQSLPTAVGNIGKTFSIINASTGSIMILASGSEFIGNKFTQNSSSITIFMEDAPTLISNNSQWRIK